MLWMHQKTQQIIRFFTYNHHTDRNCKDGYLSSFCPDNISNVLRNIELKEKKQNK